jgi:hypothetical protein
MEAAKAVNLLCDRDFTTGRLFVRTIIGIVAPGHRRLLHSAKGRRDGQWTKEIQPRQPHGSMNRSQSHEKSNSSMNGTMDAQSATKAAAGGLVEVELRQLAKRAASEADKACGKGYGSGPLKRCS